MAVKVNPILSNFMYISEVNTPFIVLYHVIIVDHNSTDNKSKLFEKLVKTKG